MGCTLRVEDAYGNRRPPVSIEAEASDCGFEARGDIKAAALRHRALLGFEDAVDGDVRMGRLEVCNEDTGEVVGLNLWGRPDGGHGGARADWLSGGAA